MIKKFSRCCFSTELPLRVYYDVIINTLSFGSRASVLQAWSNGAAINGNILPKETNCRAVKSISWELSSISFLRKSQFVACLTLSEATFPMCLRNRLALYLFFILYLHSLEGDSLKSETQSHQCGTVCTESRLLKLPKPLDGSQPFLRAAFLSAMPKVVEGRKDALCLKVQGTRLC